MTTDNPWQVKSIQDFSFLKCPECIFDTKTEDIFRNHATENHPLSLVLFQEPLKDNPIIVKNEILDLIKNEEGSYDPLTIEGHEDNISEDQKPALTEKFKDGNSSGKDVHEGEKPYKCEFCDYASAQKGNVKKHINEVHEKGESFQCESCSSKFYRKRQFKIHMRTVHEGKRDYNCTLCSSAFKHNKDRRKHFKSVHKGFDSI